MILPLFRSIWLHGKQFFHGLLGFVLAVILIFFFTDPFEMIDDSGWL